MIRILTLDDEPQMGELLGLILESGGYEVIDTSDSCEAWATLRSEPIDLFTQDLSRPGVDGWTFYRLMKQDPITSNVPVLILSARAQITERMTAAERQVDSYVTKPFAPHEVLEAVETTLKKSKQLPPDRLSPAASSASPLKQPIESHIGALQDGDAETRHMAVMHLKRYRQARDRAIEHLTRALQDPNGQVQIAAARALGQLAAPRAVDPLLALLSEGQQDDVRQTAIWALGRIGDRQAVRPLTGLLVDGQWRTRWRATMALGRIKDVGPVGKVADGLRDDSSVVRMSAAWALGKMEDRRILKLLLRSLEDPDPWVRIATAQAAGQISSPEAIQPLIQEALHDEEPGVRRLGAYALANIGEPAVGSLTDVLHRTDESAAREAAVTALEGIRDPRAVELLIEALKDRDPDVVGGAAHALGAIGDSRALPYLVKIARDNQQQNRTGVAVADIARQAADWLKKQRD